MDTGRYRIVFHGEVGLGFTSEEIRENISRLTRWDGKKIEALLASSHCIVKSDLDDATAERMLKALNNTGIICRKERLPETSPLSVPATAETIAVVGRVAAGGEDDGERKCPKCGARHEGGEVCPACGLIFAKFAQPRSASVASRPAITAKVASPSAAGLQRNSARKRNDPLATLEQNHPLGYYLGKIVLVVAIALMLRALYRADLVLMLVFLVPLGFFLYLGALAAVVERPFAELLAEHRSLLPIPYPEHEQRPATLPFATYGMILLNIVIYLGFQLRTPVDVLQDSWFFPPAENSAVTIVLSAFVSLFFHASSFSFLAGIVFLWVIGAALERRIGSGFLVTLYLFCGLLGASIGVGIQKFLPGTPLPIMGVGGALGGLLGVFVISCRRRNMTFPLPFLGLDTFIKGASYQVRWSALLVVALFFMADLGAPSEASAAGRGDLGLAILLCGLTSGLLAAKIFGLDHAAGEENEDEAGASGNQIFTATEGTLRRRLEGNPDNPDLMLQLARVLAEEELTDEARQLYRRAIVGRLSSKPKEAAEIYREFNQRHQEVFEPKLTLRLASLYQRQGDTGMAATLLLAVSEDERSTPQERETALYQYSVTIVKLGQRDEAYMTLQRFSDAFPDSPLLPKLREVVYNAAQSVTQ